MDNHKKVICSGYFDPLHVGHIEYLKKAKSLGGHLIVIVNNDNQTIAKKGYKFMNLADRMKIVDSLKYVDEVIASIDEDKSVCKSIEYLANKYPEYKLYFAKGGDRTIDNIPEKAICERYRIQIIDRLGKKIRSSSELLKKLRE